MTNDEAASMMSRLKNSLAEYCGLNKNGIRAFDLAIKALEAQDGTDTNVGSTISRQAAIDAVEHITSSMSVCVTTDECHGMKRMKRQAVIELANLPSAQPERLTDDDFETIRIHLSAIKEQLGNQGRWEEAEEYQRIIDRFMRFASAQPGPCEDAVSRKDVIDLYKRGAERIAKVKGMSVEELPHRGLDVLMNLPPVMPVRDCKGCRFKFLSERKEDNADAMH